MAGYNGRMERDDDDDEYGEYTRVVRPTPLELNEAPESNDKAKQTGSMSLPKVTEETNKTPMYERLANRKLIEETPPLFLGCDQWLGKGEAC